MKTKRTKFLALVLSGALMVGLAACTGTTTQAAAEPDYVSKLFGEDPMTVNIVVDQDAWQTMLDNAKSEEFISADVEINGQSVSNVGLRVKGNSSINSTSGDRYSFKIKFDEYVDGQTCYGLDKLVLNNEVSDNTYMKDYIAFDMMKWMGVNSSLYNYAVISVNGQYWGLYTALESYDSSFCDRVYGDHDGNLYNVKMAGMGDPGDQDQDQTASGATPPENAKTSTDASGSTETQSTDTQATTAQSTETKSADAQSSTDTQKTDGQSDATDGTTGATTAPGGGKFPDGGQGGQGSGQMPGGMGGASTGGSLEYSDDSLSSYASIFDNAVFKHTGDEDEQRVVAALKALSTGENLEQYFNVDQILRYLAVHTVLCNFDSYSSSMAQNYYLYEKDGVVSVLPWDYNLAFGGFQSQDASSVVNWAIDTPVYGVDMASRPLINQLLSNETYRNTYHQYLQQLTDGYLADFSSRVDAISAKIDSYVKEDPTALCTYDEYQKAVTTLKEFVSLRTQSITGQLAGTIPSTTDGQKADSSALIDASGITLSDMGSQGGGDHGGGQMPNGKKDGQMPPDAQADTKTAATGKSKQTTAKSE